MKVQVSLWGLQIEPHLFPQLQKPFLRVSLGPQYELGDLGLLASYEENLAGLPNLEEKIWGLPSFQNHVRCNLKHNL